MKLKDIIIIAVASTFLICGAVVGIVGGAGGMVVLATVIHNLAD